METRVAVISIIVAKDGQVEVLNDLLHEYSEFILGRMGVPYREKGLNIISIAIDAPMDRINALSGALGRLEGINAKVVYAKSWYHCLALCGGQGFSGEKMKTDTGWKEKSVMVKWSPTSKIWPLNLTFNINLNLHIIQFFKY